MDSLIYIILFLLVCIGIYLTRKANHTQKFAEYKSIRIHQYQLLLQHTKDSYQTYTQNYDTQQNILSQIYEKDNVNSLLYIDPQSVYYVQEYTNSFKNVINQIQIINQSDLTIESCTQLRNIITVFQTENASYRELFQTYINNYEQLMQILIRYGIYNNVVQSIFEYIGQSRPPNVMDINFSSSFQDKSGYEELCELNNPFNIDRDMLISIQNGEENPIGFLNNEYIPYFLNCGLVLEDQTSRAAIVTTLLNITPSKQFSFVKTGNLYHIKYTLSEKELQLATQYNPTPPNEYYLYYDGNQYVFSNVHTSEFELRHEQNNGFTYIKHNNKYVQLSEEKTLIQTDTPSYQNIFTLNPLNYNLDVTSYLVRHYCSQLTNRQKCDEIKSTVDELFPPVGKCKYTGSKCIGTDMIHIGSYTENFCDTEENKKITYNRAEEVQNHKSLCDVLKKGVLLPYTNNNEYIEDTLNAFTTHCYTENEAEALQCFNCSPPSPVSNNLGDIKENFDCNPNLFQYIDNNTINPVFNSLTNMYGDNEMISWNENNHRNFIEFDGGFTDKTDRIGYYRLKNPNSELDYTKKNTDNCQNNYIVPICQSLQTTNQEGIESNLNVPINIKQTDNVDISILNIPSRGIQPWLSQQEIQSRIWSPYTSFKKSSIHNNIEIYNTSDWYPHIQNYTIQKSYDIPSDDNNNQIYKCISVTDSNNRYLIGVEDNQLHCITGTDGECKTCNSDEKANNNTKSIDCNTKSAWCNRYDYLFKIKNIPNISIEEEQEYPSPILNTSLSDVVHTHNVYLGDHKITNNKEPRWDIPRKYSCTNDTSDICTNIMVKWNDNELDNVWKGAPVIPSGKNDLCIQSTIGEIPETNCDGYVYDNLVQVAERQLYDLLQFTPQEIPNRSNKHLIMNELKVNQVFIENNREIQSIIVDMQKDSFQETEIDVLFTLNAYELCGYIIIPIFILCFNLYPLTNDVLLNTAILCIFATVCILIILIVANHSTIFYKKTTQIDALRDQINIEQEKLTEIIDNTQNIQLVYNNIRMYVHNIYTNQFKSFQNMMDTTNNINTSIYKLNTFLQDIEIMLQTEDHVLRMNNQYDILSNQLSEYISTINENIDNDINDSTLFLNNIQEKLNNDDWDMIMNSYSKNILIDKIFDTLQTFIRSDHNIKPANYDKISILQALEKFEYEYYTTMDICQLSEKLPDEYATQLDLLHYEIQQKRVKGDRIPKIYCYSPIPDSVLEPFEDYTSLINMSYENIQNTPQQVKFSNYLKIKQYHTYKLAMENYFNEPYNIQLQNMFNDKGTYCECKYKNTSDPLDPSQCNGWGEHARDSSMNTFKILQS